MNLGIAFQLVDDALDYGGKSAKLGKNVGDDFREGKITLPVVLSFRRGSDAERAFWRRTLERRRSDRRRSRNTPSALMTKHRALEDTIERARHYGAIATDALALFPGLGDEGGAGRGGRFLHRPARASRKQPVALTHQPRMTRAAVVARRCAPRRVDAEQPEAGRARARHAREAAAGDAAQRREHVGDDGLKPIAAGFEIVAAARQDRHSDAASACDRAERNRPPARRAVSGGEPRAPRTHLGRTATPGLTSTAGKPRQRERRGEDFADAAHHAAGADRGRPARRRRSRAPRRSRRGSSSARPLTRASSRSAAAASDEPPPSPAATGRCLSSGSGRAAGRDPLGQRARRLEHEIVLDRPRLPPRSGPRTVKRQAPARREGQAVADIARTPRDFRSRGSRRRGGPAHAGSD